VPYPLGLKACRGPGGLRFYKNAFSAVLSTEGRVVGPWWEKLKPKGPKGPASPRNGESVQVQDSPSLSRYHFQVGLLADEDDFKLDSACR